MALIGIAVVLAILVGVLMVAETRQLVANMRLDAEDEAADPDCDCGICRPVRSHAASEIDAAQFVERTYRL